MQQGWRSTYAKRFNERAIQRPEWPTPPRRLTDEEITRLPEALQPMALLSRSFNDMVREEGPGLARLLSSLGEAVLGRPDRPGAAVSE